MPTPSADLPAVDPLQGEDDDVGFRIRHMLSMIRSVARRSALDVDDVATYAARLDGRIASIARVQVEAINDSRHRVALHALIDAELQVHAIREGGTVRVHAAEFDLNARAAGVLSLALHELVVNSIEGGALSAVDCAIDIAARVEHEMFLFDWTEALPDRHATAAFDPFSRNYLEDGISYDLETVTSLSIEPGSLHFALVCPVARMLPPPPRVAAFRPGVTLRP